MDGETLTCPDCGADMVLRDIAGMGKFYGCTRYPECRGTHGAHSDGRPLGIPADAETRAARIKAHEAFDALWEDALRMYDDEARLNSWAKESRGPEFLLQVARTRAYAWLGWRLEMSAGDCHMGRLDLFHCELVVAACDGMTPERVRRWAKDKRHRERVAKLVRRFGTEQHVMDLVEDV